MIDLLVATTNAGKVKEIQKALSALPIRIHSLSEFKKVPDVEETGATFEENALIKAKAYFEFSKMLTLADDSGLAVEALQGAPGIYSARYAGVHATDEDNRQKLLHEMKNIPEGKRQASFVCALALVGSEQPKTFQADCQGEIIFEEKGENGFGYDSLFYVPSLGKTTAELDLDQKNKISHRGKALVQLKDYLSGLIKHS